MRFLENITSPEGVNIGMRNISLSTCGLVPKIDMLAEKKLQLTLSVSLHAPNNQIRSSMMLGLVFIETAIIYALIVAILIIFVL